MSEATAPAVTVGDLLRIKSQYLQLELLTKAADLDRPIASATVSSIKAPAGIDGSISSEG